MKDEPHLASIRMRGRLSGAILYWLAKLIGRLLAPGLKTMEGLETAAIKNHGRGTALPPRKLLKNRKFRQEQRIDGTVFTISTKSQPSAPVQLLYIHGGAWVLDLQRIQYALVSGLIDLIDADVTIPIYPLAPEHDWTESLDFCAEVYLDLVDKFGSEQIVVIGDSAGGNIALLLAQRLRDHGQPPPAALVLYSPALDLSASGQDQPALERRDPSITRSLIRNGATLWAPGLDLKDPRISPLFADQSDLPPTLVITGAREVLDSDARRLKNVNPTIDHRSYAEMAHVFPIGRTREATHALRETAAFIERLMQ